MKLLPNKTAFAILAFVLLVSLPQAVPSLAAYRSFDWRFVPSLFDFVPRETSPDPLQAEQFRLRPDLDPARYAIHRLQDPSRSLDSFYAALRRVEARTPDATVRILHYGDSPTTADLITSDTRSLLQQMLGDAGHGFYLLAKPWAWYGHRGFDSTSQGWTIEPATQSSVHDGLYGLGGVSFTGLAGASSSIRLRDRGHTLVEVSYLRSPAGGTLDVSTREGLLGTVDTGAPDTASGFARLALPPSADSITLTVTSGQVRLFGLYFEKPGPGVVYSSLGLNGAYTSVLARMFHERHWAEQLRHTRPDLVIINYGTNESVYASYVDTALRRELSIVIGRLRAALPGVAILVMSPMDRGQRDARGEIATVPVLPRLVAVQEKLAAGSGCAFFNTFEAMGGLGTMGKWYRAEPRLVGGDFIHPMPAGARIVGTLLHLALIDGYNRHKLREMEESLARAGAPETRP